MTYLRCEKTGELIPCRIMMLAPADVAGRPMPLHPSASVQIECEGLSLWVEAGEIVTR